MPAAICDVLVIGGGPAGLRAAEVTSAAGWRTILADRMPSVGRKFLVAGRGGLNLTHSEPLDRFTARYGDDARWRDLLDGFSPAQLRSWAEELGIETFIGTSGRVFPTTKQAAPLLRRWVARLKKQEVDFRLRHDWIGIEQVKEGWTVKFKTTDGETAMVFRSVILALGGGSWPQTGSNGAWVPLLHRAGIAVHPLTPANCGYEVAWPAGFLDEAEGRPLKNIVVRAGHESVAGELLVTRYGLEGGALYQLGRILRGMDEPSLTLDLKPSFTADAARSQASFGRGEPARDSRAGLEARAGFHSAPAHASRPLRGGVGHARQGLPDRVARAASTGGGHLQRRGRGLGGA